MCSPIHQGHIDLTSFLPSAELWLDCIVKLTFKKYYFLFFENNKLTTRVALVKGINQTSHDTNLRQSCNTCKIKCNSFAKHANLHLVILYQELVRFCADYRFKPHAPPLVLAPVNFFEFQPCDRTSQAECLWR